MIVWLMKTPKNYGKIAVLKISVLVSLGGVKTSSSVIFFVHKSMITYKQIIFTQIYLLVHLLNPKKVGLKPKYSLIAPSAPSNAFAFADYS